MKFCVPEELHRNSAVVHAAGPENTGSEIMSLVTERLRLPSLDGCNVLDVGCGVRFTQAIINRGIPIGSYTGVDVYRPLIEHLHSEVRDPRFAFVWWNVHNDQYNPDGQPMQSYGDIPVEGSFDIIWLFSVFTHLLPDDTLALLMLLRKHSRNNTVLVFTGYITDGIETFENRAQLPAIDGYYSESYMRSLITSAGWCVESLDPPNAERYVQHLFVCRPDQADLPKP
jgi:SAM-dependent methyltransferase